MHWLHSKLQTIIYTDLPSQLSSPASPASLSLSLLASPTPLCPSPAPPPFPPTFSLNFWKFKLNNLPRKLFGSSHQIAHYGLWNHIPQPRLYLQAPSSLPPALLPICLSFTNMSRNWVCNVWVSRGYTDHHQGQGHPQGRQPLSLIFMSMLYNVL